MKHLISGKEGIFSVVIGSSVKEAIKEAIVLSGELCDSLIRLRANLVMIAVRSNSDPQLIYRDYRRALYGTTEKVVGPYPDPEFEGEKRGTLAPIAIKVVITRGKESFECSLGDQFYIPDLRQRLEISEDPAREVVYFIDEQYRKNP